MLAVILLTLRLVQDLKTLFESFIKAITSAINDKSPYTGGHCYRVPILADMLARAAGKSNIGVLKDFNPTEDELYEIGIAAWLHDCGKVVTPEYIVKIWAKIVIQ